ncbi:MAG TPA: hypothetical protein VFF13_06925 [archaeon]|nr:hypothetical protein [archaeon]
MDAPFKLIVIAIITILILAIALNLFPENSEETLKKIGNAIDFAEAREGQIHSISIQLKKDLSFRGELFDNAGRSVRFQCSSPETCAGERITINQRTVSSHETYYENLHFRCVKKEIIHDCAVYFGENPAQLETTIISAPENANVGEIKKIAFQTKNIGNLNAIDLSYNAIFFQKKIENGEETMLARKIIENQMKNLSPGESETVFIEFTPEFAGEYTLEIFVEGKESGFGTVKTEFLVQEGIPTTCIATNQGNTFLENNSCKTEYECSGCSFGYQCAERWRERGIQGIEGVAAGKAISQKEPQNGSCT